MKKEDLEAVIKDCSRFAVRIAIKPWYPSGYAGHEPIRYYINFFSGFEQCKAKFWFTDTDIQIQVDYRNNGALSWRQSRIVALVQTVMNRHLVPRKTWEPKTE